jgi:hypothetical protein
MARFSAMTDMARDQEDVKEDLQPMTSKAATYPYELCISFNDEIMQKLGIGEMPTVGDMIHLAAMAKVTSVSEREIEKADGTKEPCRRVELQITHLATENEDDEADEARRSRFYGPDKAA